MFRAQSPATGVLITALVVAACHGGESTAPPAPPQPPQSIHIAVSSAQLTVMCGTTGITPATLTRSGGYSGTVTITVSGLPAGVSAFLSPSEMSGSVTSAVIMMMADETVSTGGYTVTVRASSGVGADVATFTLFIVDTPHFPMSVEPSSPR